MKSSVVFALVLATALAFDLRGAENISRSPVVPVLEKESRITNGYTASRGQFPYQVGLSLHMDDRGSSWCGGSLISTTYVLTAAHCAYYVSAIVVYLGATSRYDAEVTYTVYGDKITVHPGYDSEYMQNDIALINIPRVRLSRNIQIVPLPTTPYETYAGDYGIASGWGKVSDATAGIATGLRWARMPIISNSQCAYTFGGMITRSHICVSTRGGVSTCNGDSGGPLVLESSGVQIGLTSFGGSAGCTWGTPAVFTRISNYLNWIQAAQI